MTKIVFKLLNKKFVARMVGLITGQQILVALSTGALALAGQNLQRPTYFLSYLGAFLALSILPHIFTVYLRRTEMEGYFEAYYEFIRLRLLNSAGQAALWTNHNKKEEFQTSIGPEAEGYLTAVAFSIFDIYLYVLTIVLNVLVLSFVIDKEFIWAFLLAAGLSYVAFQKLSPRIEKLIEREQESKMAFLAYLLKAWDNVFLKNSTIQKNYKSQLQMRYTNSKNLIGEAQEKTEMLVLILTVISSLPIFACIIYLAVMHIKDTALLAALIVTVPKQLSVLTNFRSFFQQITNLSSFSARFKNYWEGSVLPSVDLNERIQIQKIRINGEAADEYNKTLSEIQSMTSGRLVVTGENGAGKSTLLLKLNSTLPESFYLPANPSLEIKEEIGSESTGEKILKHLTFIENNPVPVILLDEWDANLDQQNREILDRKIEAISKYSLVLEVRHQR